MDASRQLRDLTRDLDKAQLAAARTVLRPKLRAVAEIIAAGARASSSWSTRIPRATRAVVRLNTQRATVAVEVDQRRAPHARAYEGATGAFTFRHPTHGHRDRWVRQRTRPFLMPAALAAHPRAIDAMESVVDDVQRAGGFRGPR